MISGNDLLALIEKLLGDTRTELEKVDAALQRSTAQLDDLRQRELGVLGVLARARLQEIERGELQEALDDTGKQVHALLAQRGEAQAAVGGEITAAQQALADLGTQRTAQQAVVDAAAKAVDAAQADAQQKLAADAAYRARLDAAKASDAMAALAEQKAEAARTDRVQKGQPYEADPLFMYLWARGYGTGRYAAAPFTRLLDKWVAHVVDVRAAAPGLLDAERAAVALRRSLETHARGRRRRRRRRARARDGRGRRGRRAGARGRPRESRRCAGRRRSRHRAEGSGDQRADREARGVLVGPGRSVAQGYTAAVRHVPHGADAHAARAREPHSESRGRCGRRRADRDPHGPAAHLGRGRTLSQAARHAPRSQRQARGSA